MGLVTLLKTPDVRLAGRKYLRPDELTAVLAADDLVRRAETEAARLQRDAEVACQEAKARGLQAGLEEGRREGSRQAAARLAEFALDDATVLRRLQGEIADLILRLLRDILAEVPGETFYTAALRRVETACRNQAFLTLYVSPADEMAARASLDRRARADDLPNAIAVRVDPELAPRACRLESDVGIVDASLELQLAAIQTVLERELSALVERAPSAQEHARA